MSSEQGINWQCPHGYYYTGSELDRKLCVPEHPAARPHRNPVTRTTTVTDEQLSGMSGARGQRASRPELYMQVAKLFGQRSSCPRANVGAVAVLDRRIIATGYVGAPSGLPHCDEAGCTIGPDGGCTRTIHAEANLVAWAARTGTSLHYSMLFSTHEPCLNCAQLLVNAGIKAVVWDEPYRVHDGTQLLHSRGIPIFVYNTTAFEELERYL